MKDRNENRDGYKNTKLGWFPKEWEIKKLYECCINNGEYGINAPAVEFSENLPKYIRITDINEDGYYNDDNLVSVDIKEYQNYLLNKGDILFARTGATVGKTYLYDEQDGVLVFAGFLIRFKTNEKILSSYYLKYWTQSKLYWDWVKAISMRSGQPGINAREYALMNIPIPYQKEQETIASCLSTWDHAIQTHTQLIEQKKLRKKWLMQLLLTGKKRLPGFVNQWENKTFGEITRRINRKNIELNDNVVTISAQRGFIRQEEFFSKRIASDILSHYYLLKKGEYAFNKSYSNGYPMGAFKRLDNFDKAVVTTLYICFALKQAVNSDFIKQYFNAGLMNHGLTRIAQEGGRAHGLLNIGLTDFYNLKLYIPDYQEQTAIAKVLQTADKEIEILTRKLDFLKAQKKGLMQQLLTGRKRLPIKKIENIE